MARKSSADGRLLPGHVCFSVNLIVLEPRQVLVGQDKPPEVQAAPVVDAKVVECRKHVYIDPREVQVLEAHDTLIGFVEHRAGADGKGFAPASLLFLGVLVLVVVRIPDLRKVVHLLGPKLHLGVASRLLIEEHDVKRPVP